MSIQRVLFDPFPFQAKKEDKPPRKFGAQKIHELGKPFRVNAMKNLKNEDMPTILKKLRSTLGQNHFDTVSHYRQKSTSNLKSSNDHIEIDESRVKKGSLKNLSFGLNTNQDFRSKRKTKENSYLKTFFTLDKKQKRSESKDKSIDVSNENRVSLNFNKRPANQIVIEQSRIYIKRGVIPHTKSPLNILPNLDRSFGLKSSETSKKGSFIRFGVQNYTSKDILVSGDIEDNSQIADITDKNIVKNTNSASLLKNPSTSTRKYTMPNSSLIKHPLDNFISPNLEEEARESLENANKYLEIMDQEAKGFVVSRGEKRNYVLNQIKNAARKVHSMKTAGFTTEDVGSFYLVLQMGTCPRD